MNVPIQIEIPGRESTIIFDVAMEIGRKGPLNFFVDLWRKHGDLCRLQVRSNTTYLAIHPEHVRHISITNRNNYDKLETYDVVRELLLGDGLVASRGDLWRRQRRLMAPFFTPRGIEAYYPMIIEDGKNHIERWERISNQGNTVEMIDEMMLITASIILHSMFSMESGKELLQIKDAVETMIRFTANFEMNPLQPPLWVPTPTNRKYTQSRELVHEYIESLISRRRRMPIDDWPDDLLSKLMLARDEETGEGMSDSLLRDESITIFFAGHETTAKTLSFLWYALSQNPDVEAELHAEIDNTIGDRVPTIQDLKQLSYTMQVIKETLRLYPPAPVYARDAVSDDVIDGYRIPAGSRIMLSPYMTHRHPDFWDEPEKFDPDRWLPEKEAQRHPYAYHPFAAGQRICIGNNFSLFESHILVAMLASRYAPRLTPGHQPELDMAGTLFSKNGLPMTIHPR